MKDLKFFKHFQDRPPNLTVYGANYTLYKLVLMKI